MKTGPLFLFVLLGIGCAETRRQPEAAKAGASPEGRVHAAPSAESSTGQSSNVESDDDVPRTCKDVDACEALCTKRKLASACHKLYSVYQERASSTHAVDDALKAVEFGERTCNLGSPEICEYAADFIQHGFDPQWGGLDKLQLRRRALLVEGCRQLDPSITFKEEQYAEDISNASYYYAWKSCGDAGRTFTIEEDPDGSQAEKYFARIANNRDIELVRYRRLRRDCQKGFPQGKKACEDSLAAVLEAIEVNKEPCQDQNGPFQDDTGKCVRQNTRRTWVKFVVCLAEEKCTGSTKNVPNWPRGYVPR